MSFLSKKCLCERVEQIDSSVIHCTDSSAELIEYGFDAEPMKPTEVADRKHEHFIAEHESDIDMLKLYIVEVVHCVHIQYLQCRRNDSIVHIMQTQKKVDDCISSVFCCG